MMIRCFPIILLGTDLQPSMSPVFGMEMLLWKQTFQPREMSVQLHLMSAAIRRRT